MLPPNIDPRNRDQIIQYLAGLAPFYTQEWRFSPDSAEAGSTLLMIFAEMAEENIKKLNEVQLKNRKAFYNLLGITGLSSLPSRALIHFSLSAGAKEAVFIPAKTQVFAQSSDEGEPIPFETAEPVLVTPAKICQIFNLSPALDRIIRIPGHTADEKKEPSDGKFRAFDVYTGENMQEHCLYIAQDNIFRVREKTTFYIRFSNIPADKISGKRYETLADAEKYEWLFSSSDGWSPFEDVKAEGEDIALVRPADVEAALKKINEHENYWIRCRVKPLSENCLTDDDLVLGYRDGGGNGWKTRTESSGSAEQKWRIPELNKITVSGKFMDTSGHDGILPEMLYSNDVQVDESECLPFGNFFAPYNSFYIASEEVFSKKNAKISLKFDLDFLINSVVAEDSPAIKWKLILKESDLKQREIKDVSISGVIWEYWNGKAWLKLMTEEDGEKVFRYPGAGRKSVSFKCPEDNCCSNVNGNEKFWIRARILNIENLCSGFVRYQSPVLKNIRLNYDYCGKFLNAGVVLTENNMEWNDRSTFYFNSKLTFHPFEGVEGEEPSMLMGFELAPEKGPINMFFEINTADFEDDREPSIEWDYFGTQDGNTGWFHLRISDHTNNLTKSGIVSFAAPSELAKRTLFGNKLYWLRLRNRDRKYGLSAFSGKLPQITALQMNNVYAVQQETISDEYAEKLPGILGNQYRLRKFPARDVKVWVDETNDLTENEIRALFVKQPEKLMIVRDSGGKVLKCRVKWDEVESFACSGQNDRHYKIDFSTGLIQFGDGRRGMIPSNAGANQVMVRYKIGGGNRGNVGTGEISKLQNPIAFIDKVTNPFPARGGCEMETMAEILDRSANALRNRNRAVTESDFIWIARQASQNIAKIKCLSNYDSYGRKKAGRVTIVLLHKCIRADQDTFEELRRRVENALTEHAAATVANPDAIRIIPPAFFEISVSAVLVVNTMGDLIGAEKEAVKKLNDFFNPITGNYNGRGWDIGDTIHTNNLYPLLKSVNGVKYPERINVTVHLADKGKRIEIPVEKMAEIPHGLITNGTHRILTKSL